MTDMPEWDVRRACVDDFDGRDLPIGGRFNETVLSLYDACASDANGEAVILTATQYAALRDTATTRQCAAIDPDLVERIRVAIKFARARKCLATAIDLPDLDAVLNTIEALGSVAIAG